MIPFVCPDDRTILADDERRCPTCRRSYPEEGGIPCLLPRDLSQETEKESAARDRQVDQYDQMFRSPYIELTEVRQTLEALDLHPGLAVVDAGCGTGRLSVPLAGSSPGTLVACDVSLKSLHRCREKVGRGNIVPVQADICHLPFPDGSFDRVLSAQVLEHLPTTKLRAAAVAEAVRVLKPRGRAVLSLYNHSLLMRLFGHREGWHIGPEGERIFYHRFSSSEARRLIPSQERLRMRLYGIRNLPARTMEPWLRFSRLVSPVVALDLALSRTPISLLTGHLLLLVLQKNGEA